MDRDAEPEDRLRLDCDHSTQCQSLEREPVHRDTELKRTRRFQRLEPSEFAVAPDTARVNEPKRITDAGEQGEGGDHNEGIHEWHRRHERAGFT